jgi:hypothetical protein
MRLKKPSFYHGKEPIFLVGTPIDYDFYARYSPTHMAVHLSTRFGYIAARAEKVELECKVYGSYEGIPALNAYLQRRGEFLDLELVRIYVL